MRVLAICRGAPGLGRAVPSLGLIQTLRAAGPVEAMFASYSVGHTYLSAVGENVTDLGRPDGLFIDSVAPAALRVQDLADHHDPDLIMVDGEFYLPVALAHLRRPVVYLANPHDLVGSNNTFRRVNRLLLAHANAVIISSLSCRRARMIDSVVPDTPCLEVPPIIKAFPVEQRPSIPPRVLVSMGGGSIGADPVFRESSDEALAAVLDVLSALTHSGKVARATVVLGADATAPTTTRLPEWLTLFDHPVELTTMYRDHDVFIARAGRNACAEALYCGIPTVVVPITADRHRGEEQLGNAEAVSGAGHMFAVPEWRSPESLRGTLLAALAHAQRAKRRVGVRGNDDAARFLANVVATVGDPSAPLPV